MEIIQCCSKTRSQKTALSAFIVPFRCSLQIITIELKVQKQSSIKCNLQSYVKCVIFYRFAKFTGKDLRWSLILTKMMAVIC